MRRRLPWIGLAMLLGVGGVVLFLARGQDSGSSQRERPPVTTVPNLSIPARTSGFIGVIVAPRAVDLAPTRTGRLGDVRVKLGTHVEQGEVVATLELVSERQELAQGEAALHAEEAEQKKAALELLSAREHFERLDKTQDLVAQEEISSARMQAERAQMNVELARAKVEKQQANVYALQQAIANAQLRAPFQGVVTALYTDVGATVGPLVPIVRIISEEGLRVRFAVPPEAGAALGPGTDIEVVADKTRIPAKVEYLASEIEHASGMLFVEGKLGSLGDNPIPAGTIVRVQRGGELQ